MEHQNKSTRHRNVLGFLATAVAFTVIDLLWLGLFARDFYAHHMGSLLRSPAYWPAALMFYLFYVTSIWLVAVKPGYSTKRAWQIGSAMGGFAYGVYELTNWAVIQGWPAILVSVDWFWGIFLTGSCAALGSRAQK